MILSLGLGFGLLDGSVDGAFSQGVQCFTGRSSWGLAVGLCYGARRQVQFCCRALVILCSSDFVLF